MLSVFGPWWPCGQRGQGGGGVGGEACECELGGGGGSELDGGRALPAAPEPYGAAHSEYGQREGLAAGLVPRRAAKRGLHRHTARLTKISDGRIHHNDVHVEGVGALARVSRCATSPAKNSLETFK